MAWQFFNIRTIDHFPNMDDYDYLIATLIRHEIEFTFPEVMEVSEIDLDQELSNCSIKYQKWFRKEIQKSKSGTNYE